MVPHQVYSLRNCRGPDFSNNFIQAYGSHMVQVVASRRSSMVLENSSYVIMEFTASCISCWIWAEAFMAQTFFNPFRRSIGMLEFGCRPWKADLSGMRRSCFHQWGTIVSSVAEASSELGG